MSWEQLTFLFEPQKAATPEPEQAEEPRPEPKRTAFDDEFDAWVHRRSEFDKAFLHGMRMSAEQTLTNIKDSCRETGSHIKKQKNKKTDQERRQNLPGPRR